MCALRAPAVAGQWYPGDAASLAAAVDGHLAAAARADVPCPRALVAPHAGLAYSGPVAAYGYQLVTPCDYAAVILVGPSHFVRFQGVALWPRGAWRTPLGAVAVAEDLAARLAAASERVIERPEAHGREHSLEMQLPFVARLLPGVPIVPLVMGDQVAPTVHDLGETLATVVSAWESEGRGRVLLVASSDLSHYQDARTAARLDGVVAARVEALDAAGLMDALLREPGHACGGGPMVSVIESATSLGARHARVLRYADSGDVTGDKSAVVGYLAAALW